MISLRGTGGNYIFKERPLLLYAPLRLRMSINVQRAYLISSVRFTTNGHNRKTDCFDQRLVEEVIENNISF